MRFFLSVICLSAFCFSFSACVKLVKSERLDTLLELKQDQESMDQSLKQDEENFKRVKGALKKGDIKIGDPQSEIIEVVGEPAVRHNEKRGERWAYKLPKESWFGGKKIYLFFDSDQIMTEYECFKIDCD